MRSTLSHIAQLIIIPAILVVYAVSVNANATQRINQQYSLYASNLLRGHLNITDMNLFQELDTAQNTRTGNYYWPLGLFPAVLIMPYEWFTELSGKLFLQGYFQILLTPVVFFLAYTLARRHGYTRTDSLYLGYAFCFGSIFILCAFVPWSWYLAHSISTALLLLAFCSLSGTRRWLLIGLLLALVVQTRPIAFLSVFVFLWELFHRKRPAVRTGDLAFLLIPIAVSILLYLYLNYVRFDSLFDNGYTRALVRDPDLIAARNSHSFFGADNILNNFYLYFISFLTVLKDSGSAGIIPSVSVNVWGFGFFYISPIFLFLFTRRAWSGETIPYWITSLVILSILLLHYSAGYVTYGPRYMMDLLPLWYCILLHAFPAGKLRPIHYFIILSSGIWNMLLILSVAHFFNPPVF